MAKMFHVEPPSHNISQVGQSRVRLVEMPHAPLLRPQARALLGGREALKLFAEGLRISQISERLGKSVSTVKRYIKHALSTESSFPVTLSPDEVGQLRQVQSELLLNAMSKLIARVDVMDEDPEIPNDKKVQGHAAAVKALALANTRIAEMNGLNVPVKIQEEQLRLNIIKTDTKFTISWDESVLSDPGPVEGLTLGGGANRLLGDGNGN